MNPYSIQVLDTPEQYLLIENLQRIVWPGNETDIIPGHLIQAAVHNGGLAIGAFANTKESQETNPAQESLIGFVLGIPGFFQTPDGPQPMHASHMLGVHPNYRNQGLGYQLKRAQWQMVRKQGLELVTWTYDPLLCPNAYLNIVKLGGVCSIYLENFYGVLRDELNVGLPTDRFLVYWWVNSQRVYKRLSKQNKSQLKLTQYLDAHAVVVNQALEQDDLLKPAENLANTPPDKEAILLVEIPGDFARIRTTSPQTALDWRIHSRQVFSKLFKDGYLVTDFVQEDPHHSKSRRRSYYVLIHGEASISGVYKKLQS